MFKVKNRTTRKCCEIYSYFKCVQNCEISININIYFSNKGLWKALYRAIYTSLIDGITIGHYFYDVKSFINITEQPNKYIQQPNIYKKVLYEDVYIHHWLLAKYMKDVYIRPWLLAWKYFGHKRNREWVWVERIKDVYIRPWLLERICSARKGLKKS